MVSKDVFIAKILEQSEELVHQNHSFIEQLSLLLEENQQLKEKIAKLEKNSLNSSKPPSSDIINPQPENKKKKKRKIGGQKGHKKTVGLYSKLMRSIKLSFINYLPKRSNAGDLLNCLKLNRHCNRLICRRSFIMSLIIACNYMSIPMAE